MKKNLQSGFTLIELLVVIAIISILASIIVPKISGGRDSAKLSSAKTTAKSVDNALAVADYNNLAGYWKTSSETNSGAIGASISDIGGAQLTVAGPGKVWSSTSPNGTGSSILTSPTGSSGVLATLLTSPTITRASSSTGITMGAWFKLTNNNLYPQLNNNSTITYSPFQVTSTALMVFNPSTNTYASYPYTVSVQDNKWHYILAVLKYGQYARLYIDGNIAAQTTVVPASASALNTNPGVGTQTFFNASIQNFGSGSINGYVSDLVFANEALY